MPAAERAEHNTNLVLWCAVNSRQFSMTRDAGHMFYVGRLQPKYAFQTISFATIDKVFLTVEHEKLRSTMIGELHAAKKAYAPNDEPFCCAQLDLTTTLNRSFVTFSVSFTGAGWELRRFALATKVMPGRHTAADIESFIREVNITFLSFSSGNALGFYVISFQLEKRLALCRSLRSRWEVPGFGVPLEPTTLASLALLSCRLFEQETTSWFGGMYDYDVQPLDVYVGAVADQG